LRLTSKSASPDFSVIKQLSPDTQSDFTLLTWRASAFKSSRSETERKLKGGVSVRARRRSRQVAPQSGAEGGA